MVRVLVAKQSERPDFNQVLDEVWQLLSKYQPVKVYIDGANPEVVSDLKFRYNERTDYLAEIAYYEKHHLNWQLNMRVLPVNFSQENRQLLSHLKMIVENGMLSVSPQFQDLIVSLRSAYEKGEIKLDKQKTANNDLLDGLMCCLKEYEYGGGR